MVLLIALSGIKILIIGQKNLLMISIAQECPSGEYKVPAGGSGCGTPIPPTYTPGLTFAVGVNLTTNKVTYRKLSLTEGMHVGDFVPSANYAYLITWYSGGTLTFNTTPTFFQGTYSEESVSFDLSANTITLTGIGILTSKTFSQTAPPPDFEVTFSIGEVGSIGLAFGGLEDSTAGVVVNSLGVMGSSVTLVCGQFCEACDSACATCTGGSSSQCTSCNSGFFLQPSSTTCLDTCPTSYYYADSSTNTCKSN